MTDLIIWYSSGALLGSGLALLWVVWYMGRQERKRYERKDV